MTVTKKSRFLLPGEFVNYTEIKNAGTHLVGVSVDYRDGVVVALIGKKQWTLIPTDMYRAKTSVGGCVGGYNTTACSVAYCLADLKLWSRADAAAFVDSFVKLSEAQAVEGRVFSCITALTTLGYDVSTLKKVKKE